MCYTAGEVNNMRTPEQVQEILRCLAQAYPADCSLQYQKDYELLFAVRLQKLLDEAAYGRLDALLAQFSSLARCRRALSHARRLRQKEARFLPCWLILNNMEHLTQDFPRLLDRCAGNAPAHALDPAFSVQWEQLTVYFLWRYFLKASVDGKLLSQVQSCVFHVVSIAALFSAQDSRTPQALLSLAGLYSKEVEHSEENLRLLLRVFDRKTLPWQTLLPLLR